MAEFFRALFGAVRRCESPTVAAARARAAERLNSRRLPDTRSEWAANVSMGGTQ